MTEAPLTNRQIEDIAIRLVLDRENAAGRAARDTRGEGAMADVEGDWVIEVKAYGGSARGADLWLETRQVGAALNDPDGFHLVIVDNIRVGPPRLIDIHGDQLAALLDRRREKHYFEVPLPTSVFDSLIADAGTQK